MKVMRFTASWCQPCKSLAGSLEREGIDIKTVIDIDSEEGKVLVAAYNIRSIPTIVIDYGNDETTKFTGASLSSAARDTIRDALGV